MDDEAYIPFTYVGPARDVEPEPQPRRMAPVDSADTGDDDFEEWYRTRGYKLFGTGKRSAQQWYEQRKRAAKPAVAMADPGAMLADLMDKAMRV